MLLFLLTCGSSSTPAVRRGLRKPAFPQIVEIEFDKRIRAKMLCLRKPAFPRIVERRRAFQRKSRRAPLQLLADTPSLFVRCQFTDKIAGHRNQLRMLA